MIVSFRCKDTESVFNRIGTGRWPRALQERVRIKLLMLNAAISLNDLRVPPGNRLEALRGDRAGQHSIRVDCQWRICFRWIDNHAHAVEMVDYH